MAVVITDGQSTSPEQTITEATRAHLKGILVIAIGVGHQVDNKELEAIAGSDERVFTVNDYSALDTIKEAVLTKACGGYFNEICTVGICLFKVSKQVNARRVGVSRRIML